MGTVELLEELRASWGRRSEAVRTLLTQGGLTSAEIDAHLTFRVTRAVPVVELPTVAGTARPLSPMLRARYAWASTIRDLCDHFLSAAAVGTTHAKPAFRRVFASQADNWADSVPATVAPERITLISVRSLPDGDVVYAVWGDRDEPAIVQYSGQSEAWFDTFDEYLRHLLASPAEG